MHGASTCSSELQDVSVKVTAKQALSAEAQPHTPFMTLAGALSTAGAAEEDMERVVCHQACPAQAILGEATAELHFPARLLHCHETHILIMSLVLLPSARCPVLHIPKAVRGAGRVT